MGEVDASPVRTGTLPERPANRWLRFEVAMHRTAVVFITAVTIAGLTGLLGVTERTSRTVDGRRELAVSYARIARPGLAAPFSVTVTDTSGAALPPMLTLAVSLEYLGMFDQNGLDPQPASAATDGDEVVWEFSVPEGASEFRFELDARIEPGVQWKRTGSVRLEIDGRDAATAAFTTLVLP